MDAAIGDSGRQRPRIGGIVGRRYPVLDAAQALARASQVLAGVHFLLIGIQAREILYQRHRLDSILAERTGQPLSS